MFVATLPIFVPISYRFQTDPVTCKCSLNQPDNIHATVCKMNHVILPDKLLIVKRPKCIAGCISQNIGSVHKIMQELPTPIGSHVTTCFKKRNR